MCSTEARPQPAARSLGATTSKSPGVHASAFLLPRFLRLSFLTCVPVPEWTGSLLTLTAFAVQWPQRWSHSCFGTAELISHSREGLHGSLCVCLGVKKEEREKQECGGRGGGGGEEGKEKCRRKKRRENMRRKRREDAELKMPCPKDPGCIFHFPLLSILFIFRRQPPFHTARSFNAKPRNAIPATVPTCHFNTFTTGQGCSDGNSDRTLSKLACCIQIKLL